MKYSQYYIKQQWVQKGFEHLNHILSKKKSNGMHRNMVRITLQYISGEKIHLRELTLYIN